MMITTLVDTGSPEMGNCRTIPGTLELGESTTVKAGTVLSRNGENWALYAPGEGTPSAVILYDMAAGPGNLPIDALVSGQVNRTRLVVHGGGALTEQATDQLRAAGILAVDVQQLARPDNGAEGGR